MTLDLTSRDRCYVIAEAGTNHAHAGWAGRYARALEYAEAAARAGADAVKFQIFDEPFDLFCRIEGDDRREARWRQTVMRTWDWLRVKDFAESLGIDFLASVFQYRTVEWLKQLNVKATKVASRAAEKFPYEDATGDILVSNGMFRGMIPVPEGHDIVVLQCESKYPSDLPWEGELPGYSCHSPTPDLAIDAIKRGCKLVEVHFYIDPSHAGRDLPASLTLDGLRKICAARDSQCP